MKGLTARVAIVTGGAQGIGRGCSGRLAEEGATVVVADVADDAAASAIHGIESKGGSARYVRCDVSDPSQVAQLVDGVVSDLGRVDILVNNAALVHHADSNLNFLELDPAVWERALAVNLSGMFYCGQRVARAMVERVATGSSDGGCIVNIGSGGGSRAHRQLFNYDTTKGGIEAATRAMALDLAPWGIRVNTVVPGNVIVENSLGGAIGPEAAVKTIPLGRPGTPDEIGAAVAFLASDDARYITGSRLFVDGGMDAQLRSPAVDVQIDVERLSRTIHR